MVDEVQDREDDTADSDASEKTESRAPSDDKEHQQALERLQLSAEAYDPQNERERNALAFQVPDLQWKQADRDSRKGDTVGDLTLPDRPTLSIPQIDQSIQLVLNQEKAAHLGVKVEPADERSTDETAEVQTGLYRQIERESRAGLARSWAFERAVKAGRGAWQIITVPARDYATTKDQDIRIKRILYQESVNLDPFAIEPDWSDGEWGHVLEWMSVTKYRRLEKKIKKRPGTYASDESDELPSVLAEMSDGELVKLQDTCPNWIRGEGEGRAVLTSRYYFMESRPENEAQATAAGWKKGEDRRVQFRRMNAVEFMEYGVIHSSFIPIVPAIGRELIPFEGERRWTGMYEPNADAQRLVNYSASVAVQAMAQEPQNTWVMAEGQEEGHEKEFLLANVKAFPYVRYKPKPLGNNGEYAPPPQRSQADTSKLGMSIQLLQMGKDFIHAGTSTYEPSLGKTSPNVRTKGGTLALQAQSEQANSNWLDNQAEISMPLETKIILSMLPFYYDRPGRVARILGIEDKDTKTVMLNAPFVMNGKVPQALPYNTPEEKLAADQRVADPNDPAKHYNLMDGRYGFVVSIGKGYKSRIDQGADELGQLFQAEPQLFSILGDIYLRFRDFPGHQEAADRIKKMLPPQLQDQENQDPRVELEQAKAAMSQMQQTLQEMGKALETDKIKVEGSIEEKRIDARAKLAIQMMQNELEKMKLDYSLEIAKLTNQTKLAIEDKANQTTLIEAAAGHAHDKDQNERDRAVDISLAAAGRAAGIEDGAADHARSMAEGDADHARSQDAADADLERQATLADQGQDHALEQQETAAELAPEPDAGSGEQ